MAQYESKFPELMFYVDGEAHSFKDGKLNTEDKAIIEALDKLGDAVRVDNGEEPAPAKPKAPAKNKK